MVELRKDNRSPKGFRLDRDLQKAFAAKCAEEGRLQMAVVEKLLSMWVKGKIRI